MSLREKFEPHRNRDDGDSDDRYGASREDDSSSVHPHDALFRFAFERPENARAELLAVLPEDIRDALDLDTIALESAHFVEPELTHSESDLLFSLRIRERHA